MASDHEAILQAAVERFDEEHGRWPCSMGEETGLCTVPENSRLN